MNKHVTLFILCTILHVAATAQSCLPNGITLTTQYDVDLFRIAHLGCTEIGGNLELSGLDITNLDSLEGLTRINGDLRVYNTSVLDFDGLYHLDTVMGDFHIYSNDNISNFEGLNSLDYVGGYNFDISYNDRLINFEGLDQLQYVNGMINVSDNDSLISFQGLENLNYVNESFVVTENDQLKNLNGLQGLETIVYDLRISNCPQLTSLQGITGLTSADYLSLYSNAQLTDISVLSSLTHVDIIDIYGNPMLTTLLGLDSIASISHSIYIRDNAVLTDISSLGNIDLTNLIGLTIKNNPNLAVCAQTSICNYLDNGGNATIQSNEIGCNGPIEVGLDCDGLLYIYYGQGIWNNASNWSPGTIPDCNSFVVLPPGSSCKILADSIGTCNYFHAYYGADLEVAPGGTLEIKSQ